LRASLFYQQKQIARVWDEIGTMIGRLLRMSNDILDAVGVLADSKGQGSSISRADD
jgi:hypothetical protein